MRLLAALLFALPTQLAATDACLIPVDMAQPASELELRQPYRLASGVMTIPGYPHLVIKPTNRLALHTMRGDRFEELGAAFPKSNLWQYRNIEQSRDGTVYGFGTTFGSGRRKKVLYRLDPVTKRFVREPTPAFTLGSYNAYLDHVLLMTARGTLVEWDGQSAVPSRLSGLPTGPNMVLPRYVTALGGYLAVADNTLVFRPDIEAADWQRLEDGPVKTGHWQLGKSLVHVDPVQSILAIRLGSTMLVYRLADDGLPRFAYHVEDVYSAVAAQGGPVLVEIRHRATRPGLVAGWLGAKETEAWTEAVVLTSDGVVSAAALPVVDVPDALGSRVSTGRGRSPYHNNLYHKPPLFELDGALYYFDGTSRIAVPQLGPDVLGHYPRWFRWKDQAFVLSRAGWGHLQPDLSLEFHDFPIPIEDSYWAVEISASEVFGGLVVVDAPRAKTGAVWQSSDGHEFSRVTDPSETRARKYLADVPGQDYGLVLGDGGLFLLKKDCQKD